MVVLVPDSGLCRASTNRDARPVVASSIIRFRSADILTWTARRTRYACVRPRFEDAVYLYDTSFRPMRSPRLSLLSRYNRSGSGQSDPLLLRGGSAMRTARIACAMLVFLLSAVGLS